jgi:hypothetical protein
VQRRQLDAVQEGYGAEEEVAPLPACQLRAVVDGHESAVLRGRRLAQRVVAAAGRLSQQVHQLREVAIHGALRLFLQVAARHRQRIALALVLRREAHRLHEALRLGGGSAAGNSLRKPCGRPAGTGDAPRRH